MAPARTGFNDLRQPIWTLDRHGPLFCFCSQGISWKPQSWEVRELTYLHRLMQWSLTMQNEPISASANITVKWTPTYFNCSVVGGLPSLEVGLFSRVSHLLIAPAAGPRL